MLAGSSIAEPLVVRGTAAPGHRTAVVLAAVLPLLVGVGMALVTGMWMFLAFTALSAATVLVPVVSGRRQRRALAAAVADAVLQDRERRRQAAPSAADLVIGSASGPPVPDRAPQRGAARRSGCASGWRSRGRISGWNRPIPAFRRRRSARYP